MRKGLSILVVQCLVLVILSALSLALDFSQYPGSKLDEKASQQASSVAKGMECQVYITADSYDKVYTYYKALYKEVAVPFPSQKLPNGKEVQWAFFILDGGKDLSHSKYWMKIQRPYIGDVDDEAKFQDVRDITVVQTVRTPATATRHRLF
jgi:hypothetical protein